MPVVQRVNRIRFRERVGKTCNTNAFFHIFSLVIQVSLAFLRQAYAPCCAIVPRFSQSRFLQLFWLSASLY